MKKTYFIILALLLACSVALNIVLLVKTNGKSSNNKILGVYQAQYYNNYNKSMTITLKIKEDGKCKYGDYATEYSNLENDCTWEKDNNTLIIKSGEKQAYNAEILSDGSILLNNHKLEKIG